MPTDMITMKATMPRKEAGADSAPDQAAGVARCRFGQVPVYLMHPNSEIGLQVTSTREGVKIEPAAPLPMRCTIRVVGLYKNSRGYHDITTVMGRLVFVRGATASQTYAPFSHDPHRSLQALYLPIETTPEDDRVASPQRWNNAHVLVADLLRARDVSWAGLRPGDVDKLLTFTVHEDPIEACLLHALAQRFHAQSEFIVEIGSYRGSSLSVLALALDGVASATPLISIDPHLEQPVNQERARLTLREIGQEKRLIQIPARSDDAVGLLRPGGASLIFIDGDHSYEQVVADIRNYDEILTPGGCLVMHDYGFGAHTNGPDPHPGVRRAVDELLLGSKAYAPLLCAHTMLAFVKIRSL